MTLLLLSALLGQDAIGNIQQNGATSAREKMRFAATAVSEMWAVFRELEELHAQSQVIDARRCLAVELADVEGLISVSEASTMAIPVALAEGDRGTAEQEFRKISVALARTRKARVLGFECAALPASETAGWSGAQEQGLGSVAAE